MAEVFVPSAPTRNLFDFPQVCHRLPTLCFQWGVSRPPWVPVVPCQPPFPDDVLSPQRRSQPLEKIRSIPSTSLASFFHGPRALTPGHWVSPRLPMGSLGFKGSSASVLVWVKCIGFPPAIRWFPNDSWWSPHRDDEAFPPSLGSHHTPSHTTCGHQFVPLVRYCPPGPSNCL